MNKGRPYKENKTEEHYCTFCKEVVSGHEHIPNQCKGRLEEIQATEYTEKRAKKGMEDTPIMRALRRGGRPGSSTD